MISMIASQPNDKQQQQQGERVCVPTIHRSTELSVIHPFHSAIAIPSAHLIWLTRLWDSHRDTRVPTHARPVETCRQATHYTSFLVVDNVQGNIVNISTISKHSNFGRTLQTNKQTEHDFDGPQELRGSKFDGTFRQACPPFFQNWNWTRRVCTENFWIRIAEGLPKPMLKQWSRMHEKMSSGILGFACESSGGKQGQNVLKKLSKFFLWKIEKKNHTKCNRIGRKTSVFFEKKCIEKFSIF